MRPSNPFADSDLRLELIAAILFDRLFLRECGDHLQPELFPSEHEGSESTAVLVQMGLEHWQTYRSPLSASLGVSLTRWARSQGANEERRQELAAFARRVSRAYRPDRTSSLRHEVESYLGKVRRNRAIRELAVKEEMDELTSEEFFQITQRALQDWQIGPTPVDWGDGIDSRRLRRLENREVRRPATLIEPLDQIAQPIGRGHLGLWIAPYKRGKSLAFVWLAMAYVWQGWNVLLVTLEDPREDVEDRLDACVANMRIDRLTPDDRKAMKRLKRWNGMLRSRLRVFDGTDGGITVGRIEGVWEQEKAKGFTADVILVDYDDELAPPKRRDARRLEFADIYRDLRRLAASRDILVWTASQTRRDSEKSEIVSGDAVAEDIGKVRKATLVIGIGLAKGWEEDDRPVGDAKTLYVAAHKIGRQGVACRIWSDPSRGLFYDEEKTRLWTARDEEEIYSFAD